MEFRFGLSIIFVKQFRVLVSCGNRVTIAVIPVCRIADREINLGRYLRVDSVVARSEANFKRAHKQDLGVDPKIYSKISFPICYPAYRYHCDRNPIATNHKDIKCVSQRHVDTQI